MKPKLVKGKWLLIGLTTYYLLIFCLYILFNPSFISNLLAIGAVIVLSIFFFAIFLTYKNHIVINIFTGIFLFHLFLLPILLFTISIGLIIFPIPSLWTVSILVIIYMIFSLSPFVVVKIREWVNKNKLHPKPKVIKIINLLYIGLIFLAIIFNLFIGEYLREGVGANDFAYRLFLFFYLIVILSSFAIPTIVKRMLN